MSTLTIVLTTFVSSGVATAIVSYLFKLKLERQLDRQRAFLQRQTKIHELQIDTLTKIYSHLHAAHMHLQILTAKLIDSKKALSPFFRSIDAAHSELIGHRLLIPTNLADTMDIFFKNILGGSIDESFAFSPSYPNQEDREKYYTADASSLGELLILLKLIEADARKLIHGDT